MAAMNTHLPHIAWNDQLSTGLSDIDDQHRQLVDMLNKLAELRNTKGNVDAVRQVMAELTSYAGYHFRLEEELMATWAVNPKNRAAHIKAHASFVEYLGRAEAMLTENVNDTLDHLLAFLVKWLIHHITGMDARMVRELGALGMPMAESAPEATPAELHSIHDALINTVSELYDSISVRTLELLDVNRRLLTQMREREAAENALRASEARYRALADNGQALIWITNRAGDAVDFNRPWLAFTGRRLSMELGNGWLSGVHEDDLPQCQTVFREAHQRQEKFSVVWRLRRHDGVHRWMICEGSPRFDGDGSFDGYIGHCLDITALHESEEHLQLAARVFETMSEAVMVTDPSGLIERINAAFTTISGYTEEEVRGRPPRLLDSQRHDEAFHHSMWRELQSSGVWAGEVWNRMKDGDVRPMWQRVTALCNANGKNEHYVSILSDLSEVRRAQALAEQLSQRDALTGLSNRASFLDELNQAVSQAHRVSDFGAVLLFNVDRFKLLNEARGFAAGDMVLVSLAAALSAALGQDGIVARINADEFAVLPMARNKDRQSLARNALQLSDQLQQIFREGVSVNGVELQRLDCSVGIALFPEFDAETAMDVLRRADLGLRKAKSDGGGHTRFFESHMGEVAQERYEVEQELRHALDAGQLRVYLQTQVGVDKQLVGAEALVRWEHPQRGLVPPATFVPVAEASNLIVNLDRWVLSEVCRLLARFDAEGRSLHLSINISPQNFQSPDFVEYVADVLEQSGADGNHLIMEITEGVVLGDIAEVVARMNRLRMLGIRFSLDDFGTGYSSLSYLKQLPIYELKIDRSFVRDVVDDANDAALVDAILSVARHMGLQVVAEGVETQAQADFLNARQKIVHQGYLYARPIDANAWCMSLP